MPNAFKMLTAALFVGVLTVYWFGLRPGVWAALGTLALCLAALLAPAYAIYFHGALVAGVLAICYYGPRRPRPTDAVLYTRWARTAIAQLRTQLLAIVRGQSDQDK